MPDPLQLQNIMTRPEVKRQQVRQAVLDVIRTFFPIVGTQYQIEASNFFIQEKVYSSSDQKRAILESRTLSEPVKADLKLVDKRDGSVISEAPKYTLLQLPWMTPRHTFAINGNEYSISNQPRIRPGIYTRTRANEEIESAFNLAKGKNFRLSLQPDTGKFYMELGTTKIPLYNALKAMGANSADMDEHWGRELSNSNAGFFSHLYEKDVGTLYTKLVPKAHKDTGHQTQISAVRQYLDETKMDPNVNKSTLGYAFENVSKDSLLKASQKLLKVYRGEVEDDDRDSLEFKAMHSVEDHFAERLRKRGNEVVNKVKFKMNFAKGAPDLRKFMPTGAFTKLISTLVTNSTISTRPTQINPVEIIDYAVRISPLGEGGIENERVIPDEARESHPTHFGIIDPIKTPESPHAGVDVRAAMLAAKDKDGRMYTLVYDLRKGEMRHVSAVELKDSVVAFPMQKLKSHAQMPPEEKARMVEVLNKGVIGKLPAGQVDFYLDHPAKLYGPNTNLIPVLDGIQGNRALMGAKMVGQAVPLKDAEEPLVQVQSYIPGKSHEELIADMVNPVSPVNGRIKSVTDAFITVIDKAGKEHEVPYYDNFPLATKTYLHDKPSVKEGDEVKEGQHIAESIFTRNGKLALGKNLQVAYLAYNGLNSNDASVISESASKKLTSLHMYKETLPLDRTITLSKNKFASHYPTRYNLDQLNKLDEDGIIRRGERLETGDPWVVALREGQPTAEDIMLGRLHKALMRKFRDESQAWEMDYPGEVIDVSRTAKQVIVTIKVEAPMKVGDKMCFDDKHEIYTTEGWVRVNEVTLEDHLVSLTNSGNLETQQAIAIHVYPHAGDMFRVSTELVNMLVTLDHFLPVRTKANALGYDLVPAKELLLRSFNLVTPLGDAPVRAATVAYYCGYVYCISLPEHHTLLTRRNGKVHWSGNSNRMGGKNVVSRVIPDDQMPRTEDGNPIDVLVTSAGVISRINPGQLVETALAKAAKKEGMPHIFNNFSTKNNMELAREALERTGLKDKERVYDPVEGKWIDDVMVGPQYVMKLFKSTETNFGARSIGGYDPTEQPGHGGTEGAKSLGGMEVNALLAHNARGLLQEASVIKSQKNSDFWRAVQLGLPLPPIKTTFAYNKFLAMLTGAGVRVDKTGDKLVLAPLTDADITRMSGGRIENPRMVRAKDLAPERGGLFDEVVTGGSKGTRWAHIDLAEPMVNPMFEEPVRRLLGWSQKQLSTEMQKGGEHIKTKLNKLDLASLEDQLLQDIKTAKGTNRDDLFKQIKYVRALRANKLQAGDAYILSKVPVLPPVMRPITPSRTGDLMIDDPNYLYRDLMLANETIQDAKDAGLPTSDVQAARTAAYQALHASVGLSDPVSPQLQAKNVKGFIKNIAGTSPKHGFFQSKLISKPQDLSGRGTAAPDPSLGLDEIGLPEDIAWKMYAMHVVRRLVRSGYSAARAKELLEAKAPAAKQALDAEISVRPVLYNRAPSLWRFSITAAYPKLVKGKTIKVNPFVESGFNLDYDGDALQLHLPATDKGVDDARRMTLSNLLLSDKEKGHLLVFPQHEAIIGIYRATTAEPTGRQLNFTSKKEAWDAYRKGELKLGDEVLVG